MLLCRLVNENVRHHADVLVVVIVHGIALSSQDCRLVFSGLVFDHVKFNVLWVLLEVFLKAFSLRQITECELFEIVFEAEFVVCFRSFLH